MSVLTLKKLELPLESLYTRKITANHPSYGAQQNMPNDFEAYENEHPEPITFREGLISCFSNLVRYNLGNRAENVQATTAVALGVLARGTEEEFDAYANVTGSEFA